MIGHQSVLLNESIEGLAIKPDGIYLDATFGRGGHAAAILNLLSPAGRLLAIDKDTSAIAHAHQLFGQDKRFQIFHGSFSHLAEFTKEANAYGLLDGILMDLGVSSPQLDDATRGFSFMQEGPLDMRMNPEQFLDAAYFVNHADEKEMARIFREYGEERFAGRIARSICELRKEKPISTTNQLATIVKEANPKWEKHKHPATRVFQAIRIHINQELSDLKDALAASLGALKSEGRLVVISFHSLEDRIVKQFMRDQEEGEKLPIWVPVRQGEIKKTFKRVSKAIKPRDEEIINNVRARSAVLRVGEKLS